MAQQTFVGARDELQGVLSRLGELAEDRGSETVRQAARALDMKLAEERFNVVVVGEFKRGKSTLVNALLGAPILPAAVVPLTSIVTAVTYGEQVRAEVFLDDGRTLAIEPSDLSLYVTERGNPRNRRGVDRCIVHYPSEELRDGVFLVDTPGVGSVYAHNTEAAYAFVPEADVAIFLTSSDPPISEGERVFLQDIRSEAVRMFFVLNKIDYLPEPDRSEAIEFTREVLKEALGHDVRLYPLSAKEALEAVVRGDVAGVERSGLARFLQDFRRFLLQDKGSAIVASAAAQIRTLIGDERNSIEVEERARSIPQEQLAQTVSEMEAVFDRSLASRDDMRTLLREESNKLVRMLEGDLQALRREQTPALLAEAERLITEGGGGKTTAEGLDKHIKATLRSNLDPWRALEERRIGQAFDEATDRFVGETNRLVEETVRLCGKVLQLDLTPVSRPGNISAETRFTYSFFDVPTILESLIPDLRGFLPKGMARKLLSKRVREQVPFLVDKHCGRLRWDFVQRLERSRMALEQDLDDRVNATIESLRLGVRRATEERAATSQEAEGARARAARASEELRRLDAALEAILRSTTRSREAVAHTS